MGTLFETLQNTAVLVVGINTVHAACVQGVVHCAVLLLGEVHALVGDPVRLVSHPSPLPVQTFLEAALVAAQDKV